MQEQEHIFSDLSGVHVTDRPFYRDPQYYRYVLAVDLGEQAKKLGVTEKADFFRIPLGISQSELNSWREQQAPLLEVGPGRGSSCMQLRKEGFNIFALEPSYSPDDSDMKLAPLAGENRLSTLLAKNAGNAFPDTDFEVILAIGINFQAYSRSPNQLIESLIGLLSTLKPDLGCFLTFELYERRNHLMDEGSVEFNTYSSNSGVVHSKWLRLGEILDSLSIPFSIVDSWGGLSPNKSIRISALNNDGERSATILSDFVASTDLNQYVGRGE